ncbi:MAG: winged helix-turn-helix transcriptional regulator [Thermoplasmata archaeon]
MRPLLSLILLSFFLAFAFVVGGASAGERFGQVADIAMTDQTQLFLHVHSDFDIIDSGSVIPIHVSVVDQHNVPVPDTTVKVSILTPAGNHMEREFITNSAGEISFDFTASTGGQDEYRIEISVEKGDCIPDSDSLSITVFAPSPPLRIEKGTEAVSIGLSVLIAAAIFSTEAGWYGVFRTLIFPLYTRLKKEEILDHFVRGQIYGFIMSHPGEHYNAIREHLKVTNGTLSHHLRTLEIQGFIKSYRDGVLKRFYPVDMRIPRDKGIKLSDLQMGVVEVIKNSDGATQADISKELGVSQQCVSYNLRNLSREGILRFERDGRLKRYYLADN